MIYIARELLGKPVVSIQSNSPIGYISGLLVDPHRLTVAALWVTVKANYQEDLLLLPINIRQLTSQRVIVDELESLTKPEELPKLNEILTINYRIPDKKVIAFGRKIGVATDFDFNRDNYSITAIIARPVGWQRLKMSQLRFERNQITKVDDRKIVVKAGPQVQRITSPVGSGSV